ncbi:MAG: helix-hairpin-helix domain-containing protein [Planctomycetota bacterium]|nr:helix-hairpin-helix domain-containing protein [Planctomycetota bacterium]MDA1106019.1 helix-hairpin-helix domain-containing protein [Planctomycetota bacterium]
MTGPEPSGEWVAAALWAGVLVGIGTVDVVASLGHATWSEPARPAAARFQVTIDPPTATVSTWALLPGVGPGLGQRLFDAAASGSDLGDATQLDRVKGVGPATLVRLRSWIAP